MDGWIQAIEIPDGNGWSVYIDDRGGGFTLSLGLGCIND